MKASLKTTTYKCEEQLHSLLSFWLLAFSRLHTMSALKANHLISALRAANVGQRVSQSLQELLHSKRIACGVALILLAPVSLVAYNLFDSTVDDRSWYYTSMYWYMYVIGPYICLLVWSIGALLLFPTKSKFKYLATVLPASIAVGALLHHSLFVYDYESYHNPSWLLFMVAPALAVSLLMCADYLLYRKYHLNDGNLARINGIIKTPGIPAETKIKILESLVEERENFYARV